MTDSTYRAILEEWLTHGQSRVDWLLNAAYHVLHPFRIRAARREITRIVAGCRMVRDGDELARRNKLRDTLRRCWSWTPDRWIDWQQEPDTYVARRWKGDCEDIAAYGRMAGDACGYLVRSVSLWADAPPAERKWYRPFVGHAVTVYYRASDGAAVLMSSNKTTFAIEPLGFESVAEQVVYNARKDTGAKFRFAVPDIEERIMVAAVATPV